MQTRIKPVALIATFIIVLTVLYACSGGRKSAGYYLITPQISDDAAAAAKVRIAQQVSADSFEAAIYAPADKDTIRYRLLRPAVVEPGRKYPLVLILPTSGGIGTDNRSQVNVLVKMWALKAIRDKYPAFVVAPQFSRRSSNYTSSADKNILVSVPDSCLFTALEAIDSLKRVLPVNEQKVYVMGFSMGASATINALTARPGFFRAAVAISGIPDMADLKGLTKMPLWVVHGNADTENVFATDSLMYHRMAALQSPYLRFWEVQGLDHAIYAPLFMTDLLPEWLFKQ